MNPNTTPEEMAAAIVEKIVERDHTGMSYDYVDKNQAEDVITEAIQSAQSQSQERIEELEKVVGFVSQTGVCRHLPMNEDLQDDYFNKTCARCMARQALNPKKEGSEED